MSREITPWKFVVNALYEIKDLENYKPLSLNHEEGINSYFWRFTEILSGYLRKGLKNTTIIDDRTSIEKVLSNDPLFVNINNQKVNVAERLTNEFLENEINKCLDDDIKEKLPVLIKKAYIDMQKSNLSHRQSAACFS